MLWGLKVVRLNPNKSVSKLLGVWTFLLFLILKGAFAKPAYALSTLDTCATQPACRAALGSELAPAIATPTAEGVATTITSTTAAGATTTTEAAAGVAVVGDMRLSGIAAYYLWSRGVNGQAQEKARQKYCAAYPNDDVCTGAIGTEYKFPECSAAGFKWYQLVDPEPYRYFGPYQTKSCVIPIHKMLATDRAAKIKSHPVTEATTDGLKRSIRCPTACLNSSKS